MNPMAQNGLLTLPQTPAVSTVAGVPSKATWIIRPARLEDFLQIVVWSSEEEWELGNADFEVWQRCFPAESFLCAVELETGKLMGFCAGTKHGEDIGFIGMYFVKSEYRGCGVGSALFKAVCRYLDGRNLCMAAALPMVEKYRTRSAFKVVSNWKFRTAEGTPHLENFLPPPVANVSMVAPTSEDLIRAAIAYDAKVAGMARDAWCRHWLTGHPTGRSLVAVTEEVVDGQRTMKCVGFVQLHEIHMGRLRIGPLYSETTQVARRLLYELLTSYPGIENREVVFAFVASDDRVFNVAHELGLEQEDYDLRMQTRCEVPFDRQRTFCFSDCEVNFV